MSNPDDPTLGELLLQAFEDTHPDSYINPMFEDEPEDVILDATFNLSLIAARYEELKKEHNK